MSDWYDDSLDPVDKDAVADDEDEFDWDDGNLEHFINNHGVSPEEAEEAVLDPRAIGVDARNSANERRWAVVGATEDGRVLFIVFTWRSGRIRIISAWDADRADRRRYWRH
ncbi:MAG TPA: BrnT family toxin [Chloroflexota bacterium]|nr:BrnT family toxin [Chloroflexota bacterium]